MYQRITFNLKGSPIRYEMLEGREHLVVPTAMLTEGVHEGSGGPLYYPPNELSKDTMTWNHKPIVIYHPELNGQGISACDPTVINTRKVGIMLNTLWDGKLRTESWLDKERLKTVDSRVLEALEKGEKVEVSTGLFLEVDPTEGEWNGEKYKGIARNYRADHLAILPDKVGACSIADGAGLLQLNQQNVTPQLVEEVTRRGIQQALKVMGFVGNEMSHSNIHAALSRALRERYQAKDAEWYGWIEDVYDDFFVFCSPDGKLYRLAYVASEREVLLDDGEPEPVIRVTEYRRVSDGAFVGNAAGGSSKKGDDAMNDTQRKAHVDTLIGNGWAETDREWLMSLPGERLEMLAKFKPAPAAPPATGGTGAQNQPAPNASANQTQPAVTGNTTPAPVVNTAAPQAPPKPQTVEEYISNAPPEMREVLQFGIANHNAERTRLIGTITANERNVFTKEYLETRPLAELQGLAALAQANSQQGQQPPQAPPMFYGSVGGPPMMPVINEEPLPLPVMDFSK